MRTTIDSAGRIVVPKELRDAVGIVPGPIDVTVVGNAIRIELPAAADPMLEDEDGLLVIAADTDADIAAVLTDESVRDLRDGLQQR